MNAEHRTGQPQHRLSRSMHQPQDLEDLVRHAERVENYPSCSLLNLGALAAGSLAATSMGTWNTL